MLDDQYQPDQLGEYGVKAQPAIAARMRPHLRMTQIGNVVALLSIASAGLGLFLYPQFGSSPVGYRWAVGAVVCSVLMLAICTAQHVFWLRGMAAWNGRRVEGLPTMKRVSFVAHLASYGVVLVALWATTTAVVAAGWSALASVLLTLSLILLLAAQVTAAVQYLRESGPPGTMPAHMRRITERERRARLGS